MFVWPWIDLKSCTWLEKPPLLLLPAYYYKVFYLHVLGATYSGNTFWELKEIFGNYNRRWVRLKVICSYLSLNNPKHEVHPRYLSDRASFVICNHKYVKKTERKKLVVWRKNTTKKEGKEKSGKKKKTKVKILPWSNIDCWCVMLSSPIWAGHICGELLFQPKADILGSVSVCVRTRGRGQGSPLYLAGRLW